MRVHSILPSDNSEVSHSVWIALQGAYLLHNDSAAMRLSALWCNPSMLQEIRGSLDSAMIQTHAQGPDPFETCFRNDWNALRSRTQAQQSEHSIPHPMKLAVSHFSGTSSALPYVLNFSLYAITRSIEDANQIIEQIVPYFTRLHAIAPS